MQNISLDCSYRTAARLLAAIRSGRTMKKWVILFASLCVVGSARSAELELKNGSLTRSGSYASQFVAVTNNATVLIPAIEVECGFFRGDEFLVMGSGYAMKILPKQTVFVEVLADNAALATKTECRAVTP